MICIDNFISDYHITSGGECNFFYGYDFNKYGIVLINFIN